MRPLGDVAKKLLSAACRLSAAGRAVTLAEMKAEAFVSNREARTTVSNLIRAKRPKLRIVGERRVDYRNRPVAEYAPAAVAAATDTGAGWVDLGRCMSAWTSQ